MGLSTSSSRLSSCHDAGEAGEESRELSCIGNSILSPIFFLGLYKLDRG